jgi:hypothetical protein
MKDIEGIFIPGRDIRFEMDMIGWGAALLTLVGVFIHAIGRIISHFRSKVCRSE